MLHTFFILYCDRSIAPIIHTMNAAQKKTRYQLPQMEIVEIELNNMICESNTEPIDPGTGHEW